MKLIDKDSLMEIMNCNKPLADGYHMKDYVLNQILTDIKNAPTVDAVEVIRCKDCKFHHDRTQCKKRIGAWFDDDYCNGAVRAERKEE